MRLGGLLAPAALLAAALLAAPPAGALPGQERYSSYEQETLDAALKKRKAELDPAPEGKIIEAIDIVVLDVIEDRDPAPNFLNVFHANSKDYVIRREMLLKEGQKFDSHLAFENERNLRNLRQESLAIIAPLRGSSDGRIKLLVIVKDIWSLRLNSDYRIKGGALEYLFLQPAEENLAGTHRRAFLEFAYEPDVLTFGARAVGPRLDNTRYFLSLTGDVFVNHQTGDLEGSSGGFSYGLPLYSTRREWAWSFTTSWRSEITRRFIGLALDTYDADVTSQNDNIPFVYESEQIQADLSATRSYGLALKQNLRFGMAVNRGLFRATGLERFDDRAADEFVAVNLPVSDTRVGPYLRYRLFQNKFRSMLDVETIGLQESFRVGPELYLRVQPSLAGAGSTRTLLNMSGSASYTLQKHDALLRAYGSADVDLALETGDVPDARFQVGARFVSPRFVIGRLMYDATLVSTPENYLNNRLSIGGEGRLRGYPSRILIGKDLLASNLEFRSRSLRLWTVEVAGALFYDVADAFDGFDDLRPKHGLGAGLRILFPQLGRSIMRVDWGFPVTPGISPATPFDGLVITFRQAFGVPVLSAGSVSLAPR